MSLAINLLPEELKVSKKNDEKKKIIIRSSIGLLVVMTLITLGLFVFVLLDSFQIKKESQALEEIKSQVSSLSDRESLAQVVKNRVDTINSISKKDSVQELSFNLIFKLIPPGLLLSDLNIDKNNKVTLSAETASTQVLDNFFNNLTDPKIHDGKVAAAKVNGLTRTQASALKFDMLIDIK